MDKGPIVYAILSALGLITACALVFATSCHMKVKDAQVEFQDEFLRHHARMVRLREEIIRRYEQFDTNEGFLLKQYIQKSAQGQGHHDVVNYSEALVQEFFDFLDRRMLAGQQEINRLTADVEEYKRTLKQAQVTLESSAETMRTMTEVFGGERGLQAALRKIKHHQCRAARYKQLWESRREAHEVAKRRCEALLQSLSSARDINGSMDEEYVLKVLYTAECFINQGSHEGYESHLRSLAEQNEKPVRIPAYSPEYRKEGLRRQVSG